MDIFSAPFSLVFVAEFNRYFNFAIAAISLGAFVHCVVQKTEAFDAIGTLSKGTWVGILFLSFLITAILNGLMFLGFIALCASLIYLLDVRKGIKEIGGSAY